VAQTFRLSSPESEGNEARGGSFLKALVRAIPDKLHMMLTDNRVRFIERQAMTCRD
jgi:hypothetical protein